MTTIEQLAHARRQDTLPRQTIQGMPYVLGPAIGSLGVYAIVDWIRWNGACYVFDGLTTEPSASIVVCDQQLLVPPGMVYRRVS